MGVLDFVKDAGAAVGIGKSTKQEAAEKAAKAKAAADLKKAKQAKAATARKAAIAARAKKSAAERAKACTTAFSICLIAKVVAVLRTTLKPSWSR